LSDDQPADGAPSPEVGTEERRGEDLPLQAAPDAAASLELPVGPNAALEFHRRARLAEDRLAEVLAAYRQLKTGNDEFRERTTRNIDRRFEQRRERLLLKFIDILDNLDRALDAAEKSYAGNPLIEGLILVRTQLLQTLQEEGLERIPALGLAFDPAVAESVGSQPVDDPDHHHVVVRELLRGYRLNGRIARPSRVLIGEFTGATGAAEDGGLIGADEVGAEGASFAAPEPLGEPALEPVLEDEGRSLEDIIADAERQDALRKEAEPPAADTLDPGPDSLDAEPLEEPPLLDEEPVAEPDAADPLIREAFGSRDEKD
jgi:molecular chaperone GrpE